MMMIKPLALWPLLATSLLADPIPLFIGTQTGGSGKSEGIYATTFDQDSGDFGKVTLAARYPQPGFIVLHPTRPLLYCAGQPEKPYPDKSSSLAAFRIDAPDKLTFVKDLSTGGLDACHLAIDATSRAIAIANYGDGHVATIELDGDGIPQHLVSLIKPEGSGPNKARQAGPHAHGVYFDKLNHSLFVPDLGLDRMAVYSFDPPTATLDPKPAGAVATAPGAGPRHLALSQDGRDGYLVDELDNTVTFFRNNAGEMIVEQKLGTLPDDWKGENTTAEIELHSSGKFLYASNRGHDSIAVFSRDLDSGRLALVQIAPCGGRTPRHFKISPDGKWLLCAHQAGNTLAALPLDPETGKLGAPAKTTSCPNPICILFAPEVKN